MSWWRSSFELEIANQTPDEVLDAVRRVGIWHPQGLRVRVRGNRIRARRVQGAASDTPLLKASVNPAGPHTRLVGKMHWAASHVDTFLQLIAPALFGFGIAIWGIVDSAWQPIAIGGTLALVLGWLSVSVLRSWCQTREVEISLMRKALVDAIAPDQR